jgi:hypothetical protein
MATKIAEQDAAQKAEPKQYRVRLSKATRIGTAFLKPGAERIRVDEGALAELQAHDAVVDFEEVSPFEPGITV